MKHFNKIVFFSILILMNYFAVSQQVTVKPLTHVMSKQEKALMKTANRSFSETPAPTGEVRNIAEWEPSEGVIIAYTGNFGIPYSLIAQMSNNVTLTTIVANASEETTVRNLYTSNSVNLANCNFVYQDPDSYWARDYSPWFIAIDNSEVALVNFPYNRPRPNDNDVPILMSTFLNVDLYGMNVTHTGGNYMCDGMGAAASTDLVFEEESQSDAVVLQKMEDYLGIENYHVRADPQGEYIKHIDCWGKFLDVDKILIAQVPVSHPRYSAYETEATYWQNATSSYGTPYQVFRVFSEGNGDYSGDQNPYTNSLIQNKKVFVPQTGSQWDDEAITVYEEAMPGYEIIGVMSNGWLNTDALHCRTHEIADREMLYIKHIALLGEQSPQDNFEISAEIYSYGGSNLKVNFPKLKYKINEGSWQEIIMTESATRSNTYTAEIPAEDGENIVSYYILAENENGKSETHPYIGESDPHVFNYNNTGVGIYTLNSMQAKVYPNPNNGVFILETSENNPSIKITSIEGRTLYNSELNSEKNTIDISEFGKGVYFVELNSENKKFVSKIIVK